MVTALDPGQDRIQITIDVEDKARHYTQVSNMFLRAPGLTHGARLTYCILRSYAWTSDNCWPTLATLAGDLAVTPRQVRNYLGELVEKGCIRADQQRRSGGTFGANLYELVAPHRIPHVIEYVKALSVGNILPAASPEEISFTHRRKYPSLTGGNIFPPNKTKGEVNEEKKTQLRSPAGDAAQKPAAKRGRKDPPLVIMTPLLQEVANILPGVEGNPWKLAGLASLLDVYPNIDHIAEASKCIAYHGGTKSDWYRSYMNWLTETPTKTKSVVLLDGSTGSLMAGKAKPVAEPTARRAQGASAVPLTFNGAELPFWPELVTACERLSKRETLPMRNPGARAFLHMVPRTVTETEAGVTIALDWFYDDGRAFNANAEEDELLHRDWAGVFRKVASRELGRTVDVQWVRDA